MNEFQELVADYHEATGQPNRLPTLHKHIRERQYRQILHQKAIGDLKVAMDAHNGHEVSKRLALCLHRLLGTAVAYGIDMESVFKQVHEQLMSEAVNEPF